MQWRLTVFLAAVLGLAGIYLLVTGRGPRIPVPDFSVRIEKPIKTPTPFQSATQEQVEVGRVIDGDTVELTDGRKVRYIGIDTPELGTAKQGAQCYALQARDRNRELVEGKTVSLRKDISETDKYGRILRYVYVGDVMVNDALVYEGFARVATFPPDVAYADRFLASERSARQSGRGLWSGCPAK